MPNILRPLLLCLSLIALASLGACTVFRSNLSWADDLPGSDRANVAETVAALVADRIPPGGKPVALVAPSFTQAGSPFAGELKSALEARGYTILEDDIKADDVHRLRYLLTAYRHGYLLRIYLDDIEASTILSRGGNGQLAAIAPLAIRGGPL